MPPSSQRATSPDDSMNAVTTIRNSAKRLLPQSLSTYPTKAENLATQGIKKRPRPTIQDEEKEGLWSSST